jgi:hypothetical protein
VENGELCLRVGALIYIKMCFRAKVGSESLVCENGFPVLLARFSLNFENCRSNKINILSAYCFEFPPRASPIGRIRQCFDTG